MTPEDIVEKIRKLRIPYSTEREMQEFLANLMDQVGIKYQREYRLSGKDIVDFMIDGGIALECKVKGQPLSIYRQLKRYTKHPEVTAIILFTGMHMGVAEIINDKPAFIIKAGAAWL